MQMTKCNVVTSPDDYNFEMHVTRALVTNFFPADYDVQAPLQTLRHRLYITLHAIDRRTTGQRLAKYTLIGGTVPMTELAKVTFQPPSKRNEDEYLAQLCDEKFAKLVTRLRPLPQTSAGFVVNRSGTSYLGRWRGSSKLASLQGALACLQPTDLVTRTFSKNLQYLNKVGNDRAVGRPLVFLRQPAEQSEQSGQTQTWRDVWQKALLAA